MIALFGKLRRSSRIRTSVDPASGNILRERMRASAKDHERALALAESFIAAAAERLRPAASAILADSYARRG